MPENSKYKLCSNIEEIFNHIECKKLAPKKYSTKYEWVGKVMNWDLFKGLKFEHADYGICPNHTQS